MKHSNLKRLLIGMACLALLAAPAAAAQVDADAVYCFRAADFEEEEPLAGICITELPDPGSGTVKLGTRVLQPGDILTAQQLESMTFHPLMTQADKQAQISYLPIYPNRVEAASVLSVSVIGKTDKPPVAEDSSLETYRNLPSESTLKVKDPENQKLTYSITRFPKRGDVVIREDGSFIYTPKKNKVGVDSFAYTATDPAGNVSREATVTVTVMKPSDATQYSDTAGQSCRFAAEWMKNTGIFVAESINGNGCFQPEKQVSRGEFLTMLVGALEIPTEKDMSFTGFTDEAPQWLKPYLAAAMRSGLTAGLPGGNVFGADTAISGAEAAVMLQNALDLRSAAANDPADDSCPAWAADALNTLGSYGISLRADAPLTRGEAAQIMYRVSQLKADAPGFMTIRAAQ